MGGATPKNYTIAYNRMYMSKIDYYFEKNHNTHSPVACCLNNIHNDGAHTRNSSTKTDCC
jgi:hypothetical protein